MGIDGSAGLYRYVLVVGQEWGRLCRAGISFLSVVPATLFPKVVYFSFSAERKKPDAGNYYDDGHCI